MNINLLEKNICKNLLKYEKGLINMFNLRNSVCNTRFFYIDNFIDSNLLLKAFDEVSKIENFSLRDTFRERKYTLQNISHDMSPTISLITDVLQRTKVINIISKITGIDNLMADSTLYASGISKMDKGHFLNPHIDNSHNNDKTLYRRLNLLFYITPNYSSEFGGNLELWDSNITNNLKIPFKFNRLVVMETKSTSWHSVDHVKADVARCCISSYFFTKEPPEKHHYYNITSFSGRPDEKLKRIYGVFDNYLRQKFANITGFTRGRNSLRN